MFIFVNTPNVFDGERGGAIVLVILSCEPSAEGHSPGPTEELA